MIPVTERRGTAAIGAVADDYGHRVHPGRPNRLIRLGTAHEEGASAKLAQGLCTLHTWGPTVILAGPIRNESRCRLADCLWHARAVFSPAFCCSPFCPRFRQSPVPLWPRLGQPASSQRLPPTITGYRRIQQRLRTRIFCWPARTTRPRIPRTVRRIVPGP